MGNQATKEYSKYHRHATSKKNVHWEEAERPHPPGQPLLVPASPGTQNDVVTVRWDPPISDGGSPITGYLVEHRRTGSPHWVRATPVPVPRCQLTMSGLEPGWRYQFRVAAENAAGRSDPSAVSEPLTVTLAKGVATAPHFTKELQDTTALENEKVELTVRVTGAPPPKISWFKDGLEVFSGRRSRVVTDAEGATVTSTLIIHQAALADEGELKCAATNRAGHAVTKARLRLEAPPSIRLPRQYEDGLLFELGEVIRVKVSVAGRPPPRVSWLHNGEALRPGPRHEMTLTDKGAALRVSEAQRSDRGEYQVRAVNQLGEDVAAFLVTVTDRPTPPGKATVAMTLGRSVTLSWGPVDDDGGCKIGNYIVEYYRVGWDMWLKAATCRQLNATLGDLIEGSEYKFRVKAENPYGISDPGDESEIVFIPDAKRGIHDPPQKTGEHGSDWWPDRKRRRDAGPGASAEDADDARLGEKKAQSTEVEGVSPSVSPIPPPTTRPGRAAEKAMSLPRTRSAAPDAASLRRSADGDVHGAPEPPKRRNRSVPRRGDSISPEPDSLGSYLPTSPDEMGVVKGRLYGIHLSTDSVRHKHRDQQGGIEEVIYPPLPSPRPSPARSPAPRSPARSPAPRSPSPGRSPRRSPIGGAEVSVRPEFNGVLNLRQMEEYTNKYEAKLLELERRQRELDERSRQRQREMEEQQRKEAERARRERDSQATATATAKKDAHAAAGQVAPAAPAPQATPAPPAPPATPAVGQDRLFPRSEDGSVTGDSSEFLLVLLPNSRATTEEREASRSQTVASLREGTDADGEPAVAPPMSLSAPELGAIDPDVPFMRNAVSSTELLHERAMARFYQEVAEEEAEKARRRRMSIERRVSLERRLSIERKNRERLKGRMDSVDEDVEDDSIPVNFKRFGSARPSDGTHGTLQRSAPGPVTVSSAARERVATSEEREQAEFAALRERLGRMEGSTRDAKERRHRHEDEEEDEDDYLEEEEDELGEEGDEEEEEEDSEEFPEEDDEDMPVEQPEEETYHPRFVARPSPTADDTPPRPPPHRKAPSPEPELFIPKAETYTSMAEHDNVASVLLTKRHSPVKGNVKPKPILKRRGSARKSKSPGSKSPQRAGPISPLLKIKDKLRHGERRQSTESVESDKQERRKAKPANRDDRDDALPPAKARSSIPDEADEVHVDLAIESADVDLGISAAEAARTKRGLGATAPRRESLKDEATKVVISHYSDLVREYGSAHRPQQPKYLTFDELRARAGGLGGSTERLAPVEPPSPSAPVPVIPTLRVSQTSDVDEEVPPAVPAAPVSSISVREDLLARREARRDGSAQRKDSFSTRRDPSKTRRDSSVAKGDAPPAKRDSSVVAGSRRCDPSSSSRMEPSVSQRDGSVSRRDVSVVKRDGSVSKRDVSVSRRDGSVSRRDGSVSRRDGSASRRDGSVVRRSATRDALGRDRGSSLNRSQTSVASSDDTRPRTPEEEQALAQRVEENVKSAISYATDVGMVVLAVWLYLSRSEVLALPVLALVVYRQAKEEVRRRLPGMPGWLVRLGERVARVARFLRRAPS